MSSSPCKTCGDNVSSLVALYETQTQKSILGQTKLGQSLYIQNIASLSNYVNRNNEGAKHDSYQRYLLKKKGKVFATQENTISSSPKYGNKRQNFSLTSKQMNCNFCK